MNRLKESLAGEGNLSSRRSKFNACRQLGDASSNLFNNLMRVLPVMDLLGGQAVNAVGGNRREYQPMKSQLANSCHPLAVARALRNAARCSEIYLADLDAIAGADPKWQCFAELMADGFGLWVDAGIVRAARAKELAARGISSVVVGLETAEGPHALKEMVEALGDRLVFSLDLRDGQPMGNLSAWGADTALGIAQVALDQGVRRLLVLDLRRVGLGSGVGTTPLLIQLRKAWPWVELSAGGGIGSAADLNRLQEAGVAYGLVASALHDGRLTHRDIEALA
jgi:phosphoribosylformimino-5-aminoimidazole carboxamide ribotide isomerase